MFLGVFFLVTAFLVVPPLFGRSYKGVLLRLIPAIVTSGLGSVLLWKASQAADFDPGLGEALLVAVLIWIAGASVWLAMGRCLGVYLQSRGWSRKRALLIDLCAITILILGVSVPILSPG